MRILIDTNIFIYREEDCVVKKDLTGLLQILNQIKTELVVHPLSIEELKKDKNTVRKNVNISKIQAYSIIQMPPDSSKDLNYCNVLKPPRNTHDKIDNEILYSLYKNTVDFLITEDAGIHKKAQKINISDRVFLITEAIEYFSKYQPSDLSILIPPALKECHLYNIDVNDPFFDSLREGYPDFNEWFIKKSREDRKCYAHKRSDGSLGAILICKDEDEFIPTKFPLPKKRRLKISTMKVTYGGHRIGELLLKVAIDKALKNNIHEIYLTHYTESEDRLVDLITEYGFYRAGELSGDVGEDVYIKHLTVEEKKLSTYDPIFISRFYYPCFFDGKDVNKFIVPIWPKYHEKLFTDFAGGRQTALNEHFGEFNIEGNTIKKAYLTHSPIKMLSPGDLIFFYRSKDMMAVTSIGVIENFYSDLSRTDDILRIIGNRSVYSSEEIEISKKPLSLIMFRHHFHLKNNVELKDLIGMGILSGYPQSITKISDEKYVKLKGLGDIDERFTVH